MLSVRIHRNHVVAAGGGNARLDGSAIPLVDLVPEEPEVLMVRETFDHRLCGVLGSIVHHYQLDAHSSQKRIHSGRSNLSASASL